MMKSKCCHSPVKEEGIPDFIGDDYVCTIWYSCTKCKEPCDFIRPAFHVDDKLKEAARVAHEAYKKEVDE